MPWTKSMKQREWSGYGSKPTLSDILPSARLYHLNLSQMSPPTESKCSNTRTHGGHLSVKPLHNYQKKKIFHVPSGIYHIIKTCSKQSMWIHTKNSCFHGYWNAAASSQLVVVLGQLWSSMHPVNSQHLEKMSKQKVAKSTCYTKKRTWFQIPAPHKKKARHGHAHVCNLNTLRLKKRGSLGYAGH